MGTETDFRHEFGVRGYAVFNLAMTAAVIAAVAAGVWAVPALWARWWWLALWLTAGALAGVLTLLWLVPLLVRGGVYRVVVAGGRLTVSSPHWSFGPSFDVAVADIARVTFRHADDGPDWYEVHTAGGEAFDLSAAACGGQAIEAVRRLRPDLPVEVGH